MKTINFALYFTILAVVSAQPGYNYQPQQLPPTAPVAPPTNHHHQHHHHHQIGAQPAAPISPPQHNSIYSPIQSPPLQSFNAPPPSPPVPVSQPVSIPLLPPVHEVQEVPLPQAPSQLPQQSYVPPSQNHQVSSLSQSHQQQIVQQQVVQQQQAQFGGAQLSLPIRTQQQQPLSFSSGGQQQQPFSFTSGGQGGFQQNFQSFQQRPQTAIITKDIYIHSAPEDQEESLLGQQLENAPIRKNYRIVFIKAPTQNFKLASAALRHAQNANEDKTVIYVLSKKPDLAEVQQQLQQAQGQQKSHKPEVYFIKYKNQEEAQRAQQEIQAQYDALGGSTHISDEGIAPITSVSGTGLNAASGGLNLGGGIAQQHSSFVQQNFQSAVNYDGPTNKYLPIKKK